MLFPLLLQGLEIKPCKSALKLDTLTTDRLGYIQHILVLKFPDLVKHLMNVFFHAAALYGILLNYGGKANCIVTSP